MAISLFKCRMADGAAEAVSEVLASGYVAEGEKVMEFEAELGRHFGFPNPLCVNSATSAIWLALDLAGVGPGDTVVSTPMTCVATNLPILQRGASIVWADVDPENGNISIESLDRCLKKFRPKAVVTVDYGGIPVLCDEVRRLCVKHGALWIDDAAHAIGTTYQNRPIGKWADLTAFSYQAIKLLSTGDGGSLVCLDPKKREEGRLKRWFGLDREAGGMRCEQDIKLLGYKFHMNDIAATLGLANLEEFDGILKMHRYNAQFYERELAGICDYAKVPEGAAPNYYLFTLLVDDRPDFVSRMAENGVEVARPHRRNDVLSVFKGARCDGELQGVAEFDRRQVAVPVGWWIGEDGRQEVLDSILESL